MQCTQMDVTNGLSGGVTCGILYKEVNDRLIEVDGGKKT